MIKPINNYVFFTCEKEFENELRLKAGLVLTVATQADHGRFNRIYGDVIAVPGKLTKDVNLYQRDVGVAQPKVNYSGEMIEAIAKVGHKLTGQEYECTPYERQYATLADIAQDVCVGDRIYFHYNTIDEENKYTLEDGQKIYKVRYDSIFCTVRNGEITMIAGHILVSDILQHGVVEVEIEGKKVRGKISKHGIVEEISQATEDLEWQTFEGILEHIGPPLKGESVLNIKPGDKVLCSSMSNWKNVINGKEYFVMKQRDIIAKINE